jgi:hypothetical protein
LRFVVLLFAFLALLALGAIRPAPACDLCGCPVVIDPTSSFFEPGFSFGLSEQYTRFGTLQLDGNTVGNPFGQSMNSSVTQVYFKYNFDRHFGLLLNAPFIARSWRRIQNGGVESGSATGLGDMSLVANYLVYNKASAKSTLTLNLQGGLKLPTGSAGFIKEELSEMDEEGGPASAVHGHDLAFGSGSVDGILGANVFLREDRFFFAANLQYSIRTRGAYGYRYADDFIWSAGPGIYLSQDGINDFKLRLNFSGEVKGRDNLNGITADDTGATNVFVGPQLIGNFGRNAYAQIGVDLPIARDNTALQIVPDYRVNANVNLRL